MRWSAMAMAAAGGWLLAGAGAAAVAAPAAASAPAKPRPGAEGRRQAATTPSAVPTGTAADPLTEARALLKTLYDTAAFIQRVQERAAGRAVRAGCVAEKLAEAKIGIRIAGDEMGRLQGSIARKDDGERDYALRRLRLLAERTHGLEQAARTCTDDDRSSVDVTQVKVEIAPQVPADDVSQAALGSAARPLESTRPR
jgi:hypothetical protein